MQIRPFWFLKWSVCSIQKNPLQHSLTILLYLQNSNTGMPSKQIDSSRLTKFNWFRVHLKNIAFSRCVTFIASSCARISFPILSFGGSLFSYRLKMATAERKVRDVCRKLLISKTVSIALNPFLFAYRPHWQPKSIGSRIWWPKLWYRKKQRKLWRVWKRYRFVFAHQTQFLI